MNLENVRDRIWYSVRNSVMGSARISVRDSVYFGLTEPIRQERRQG